MSTHKPRLVESANALSAPDFFRPHILTPAWKRLEDAASSAAPNTKLDIRYFDAKTIPSPSLNACLDLIEQTSAEDYRGSEVGWSRSKKRDETKLPDMKYLLLFSTGAPTENGPETVKLLAGFISFMVTYEDDYEVIYIYEVHLAPAYQSMGLGRKLIDLVETIGRSVGLEKVMLTVFKANERATRWYYKLGYTVDEFSPPPRKLRRGVIKEPTYIILSKRLKE